MSAFGLAWGDLSRGEKPLPRGDGRTYMGVDQGRDGVAHAVLCRAHRDGTIVVVAAGEAVPHDAHRDGGRPHWHMRGDGEALGPAVPERRVRR